MLLVPKKIASLHRRASFEDNKAILETFGIVSALLLSLIISIALSNSFADISAANARFGFLNNTDTPPTRRASD